MRFRLFRHWVPLAFVLPGLALGGCEDDRGAPTAPDTGVLDGGVIFGSALVSSLYFALQNEAASFLLALHESPGISLPLEIQGCGEGGAAVITDNNDSDPNTYRIVFGGGGTTFLYNCSADLTLSLTGSVLFRFIETGPGLDYKIEMPSTKPPANRRASRCSCRRPSEAAPSSS